MSEAVVRDDRIAPPRHIAAARPRTDPVKVVSIAMVAVLALLVVPPFFVLVQNSFFVLNPDGSHGAFTLENFTRLVETNELLKSAANSVTFAALSTVVALVLGGSLAWVVERTETPMRSLAYLTTFVSLSVPLIIYVPAWMFFLGPVGPVNDLYRQLTGNSGVIFNVSSMSGMVLIEAFGWLPMTFLLFAASFRSANAELEEAARMSGATVFGMMRRVSIPLAAPAALAAGLFIFVNALTAFDVPKLVGTAASIDVLTTDIYDSIRTVPPSIGHASAFSLVLTLAVAVLMYFYSRINQNAARYATVTGKGYRPRPIDLGRWRFAGTALVLVNVAIVLVIPLATLMWVAVTPYVRAFSFAAFDTLSLDNFVTVLTDKSYLELVVNTMLIAALAATATMALMLVAGWLVARRRAYNVAIDQLATLPLLLPGLVLSVAMMDVALRSPIPLYSTMTIVVIAFTIHYLPYGMRYAFNGALQIHNELEEAAGTSGASWFGSLRRVVVPLILPSIIAGWLFVFLNASRNLSTAIILAGPDTKTIAVAIFDRAINGQFSEVAALGLLWSALMSLFAMAFFVYARRQAKGTLGL